MSEDADKEALESSDNGSDQAPASTSQNELERDSQQAAEEGVSNVTSVSDAAPSSVDSAAIEQVPEDSEVSEVTDAKGETSETPTAADFAKMVEDSDVGAHSKDVAVGDRVSGVVVRIGKEVSFVDFGGRSEGMIKTSEINDMAAQRDKPETPASTASAEGAPDLGESLMLNQGDPLEAYVMEIGEEIVLSRFLQSDNRSPDLLYQAFKSGIPVEGKVDAVNKWGLGVDIQGCRAFCPISQIDTEYVADTAPYRDQTMTFRIMEFRNQGRNIVVSRRALLQVDQDNAAESVREGLTKGRELKGKVTRLEPFGAFVDLGGGVEGLIHVSELSHQRVEHPKDVLERGQEVTVAVIKVKDLGSKRKERISLSLKALEKDPWSEVKAQFPPGTIVKGTVESLEDFGAFVRLGDTVSGMVHVSEIADKRIQHPREAVSVGDEVTVAVLELDNRRRHLRLSIKQVESLEDAANLKEFNNREKEQKEDVPVGNALTDALKRAGLN